MAEMAESGSAKNAFYAVERGLHGAARFAIVRAPSRTGSTSRAAANATGCVGSDTKQKKLTTNAKHGIISLLCC
jgi:hypothetical protein